MSSRIGTFVISADKEAYLQLQNSHPDHLADVWVYLRKSREDREAEERARREGRDEIETLSRHRKTLLDLAEHHHHDISRNHILEEVVSGEYISERPEMLRLLQAVENGEATAVWVMDLDRLGRGDMADQGTILRTFKEAGTLILTPDKTYDLNDEMDEEWTEFKTFFARRELKMITKRMQRGRVASVREGKYIGTRPPFGYDVGKDLILVPNQDAETVRMIFDLYVNQGLGSAKLSRYLNERGIKSPMGKLWRSESLIALIRNPVYAGRICWKKVKTDKRRGTYRKRPESEWIQVQGKHEPLVDEATFERSIQIRSARSHVPVRNDRKVASPLTSLIICAKCGERLVRRPYADVSRAQMRCKNPACKQRSTNEDIVEAKLLTALTDWLRGYQATCEEMALAMTPDRLALTSSVKVLSAIDTDIERVSRQHDKLHDFLEQGIYDADTYLERNRKLLAELSALRARRESVANEIARQDAVQNPNIDIIPQVTHVLDAYRATADVAERNALLRTVIEKAVYNKETWQRGDEFELTIYPLVSL